MPTPATNAPASAPEIHPLDLISLGKIVQIRERLLVAQAAGTKVFRFESGDPSFAPPAHVLEAVTAAGKAGKTHYVPNNGVPELRRALDWLARESVRQRWFERAAVEAHAEPHGRAGDTGYSGEHEDAELLHAIVEAIEAMPERRRVVCSLRWRQGMSLAEIATSLGISQKTVETQLSRGLKQLRDQFQPE